MQIIFQYGTMEPLGTIDFYPGSPGYYGHDQGSNLQTACFKKLLSRLIFFQLLRQLKMKGYLGQLKYVKQFVLNPLFFLHPSLAATTAF
jgi:hypothetical protein